MAPSKCHEYLCRFCAYSSPAKCVYKKHLSTAHDVDPNDCYPTRCRLCQQEFKNLAMCLIHHRVVHLKQHVFCCDAKSCTKKFLSLKSLEKHRCWHASQPVGSSSLTVNSDTETEQETTNDQREITTNFQCQNCRKKFCFEKAFTVHSQNCLFLDEARTEEEECEVIDLEEGEHEQQVNQIPLKPFKQQYIRKARFANFKCATCSVEFAYHHEYLSHLGSHFHLCPDEGSQQTEDACALPKSSNDLNSNLDVQPTPSSIVSTKTKTVVHSSRRKPHQRPVGGTI